MNEISFKNLFLLNPLYAIRHTELYTGPTDQLIEEFIQEGPSTLRIDPFGLKCLDFDIIPKLKEFGINRIYTSSSVRTQETALKVAECLGVDVITLDSLAPRSLGPWQFYQRNAEKLCYETSRKIPNFFKNILAMLEENPSPDAESNSDFQERIVRATNQICSNPEVLTKASLWVSHASCISALASYYGKEISSFSFQHKYELIVEFKKSSDPNRDIDVTEIKKPDTSRCGSPFTSNGRPIKK